MTVTDLSSNEIRVKHTFPYNPESKTAPTTAKRWASNRVWDYKTRQYIESPEPELLERANDPFDVTIIDLGVRSEGGRAYKVVDRENRCFDLREDQALEVFKRSGVLAGGKIPGQFVWGILGSQLRMVLVGGDLYHEMVAQAEKLKSLKRDQALGKLPSESSLRAGCIYRKRDKSLHLFLGRVKQPGAEKTSFAFIKLPESPLLHDVLEIYDGYGDQYAERAKHLREEHAIAQKWDQMTWPERCQWDWYDSKERLHRQYKDVEPWYYHNPADIVLMASPKFEEELIETAQDLAGHVRDNAGSKHRYVNGHGEDLAEQRWEKEHNGGAPRSYPDSGKFWYDAAERTRRLREYWEQRLMARIQFQKDLQWEE